jgi:hypothetical protein
VARTGKSGAASARRQEIQFPSLVLFVAVEACPVTKSPAAEQEEIGANCFTFKPETTQLFNR